MKTMKNSPIQETISAGIITHPIPKFQQDWINELKSYIRQNIRNPNLLIADISMALGVSERQLFRRVKSILGVTPHTIIRNIRMDQAKRYLEKGMYATVAEVSFAVGYNRPEYFSNEFEKIFGCRPIDYILSFKNRTRH